MLSPPPEGEGVGELLLKDLKNLSYQRKSAEADMRVS